MYTLGTRRIPYITHPDESVGLADLGVDRHTVRGRLFGEDSGAWQAAGGEETAEAVRRPWAESAERAGAEDGGSHHSLRQRPGVGAHLQQEHRQTVSQSLAGLYL